MNEDGPRPGGVLRLFGPGALGHLDPVAAPRPPIDQLTRLVTRQLFTYPAQAEPRSWQAVAPLPDLAAEIPSIYNAGVGASYTSYVVHLRPGVHWDTTPPRPVTTHDVVRGFQRLGNPLTRPPVLRYFTSTIRGMAEFCQGYRAAFSGTDPSALDLAEYQNSHDIPGLLVLDEQTLVFELVRPALDFINLLALPCAAPAPVEYDAFLPDSPEWHRNQRSTGPYRIGEFTPGRYLRLERNPVWRAETDPVRRQYPDAVEIRAEPVTVRTTLDRIRSGQADLAWGARPVAGSWTEPGNPPGFALDPYLVFNTRSPNAGAMLAEPGVRRAISYAIDKATIAAAVADLGTGTDIRIAGSAVPPGSAVHQSYDPCPTPESHGDPATCRALLDQAGRAAGLVLTAIAPRTESGRRIAECYTADLAKAGITVRLRELDEPGYHDLLRDPARAVAGEWDIATASWSPGWPHHNGRVFAQALFAGDGEGGDTTGTANYGGYHSPEVDELIEQALDADEQGEPAKALWRAAERAALDDAAIVPILFQAPVAPEPHGAAVRDAAPLPALGYAVDLATLWLDDPDR